MALPSSSTRWRQRPQARGKPRFKIPQFVNFSINIPSPKWPKSPKSSKLPVSPKSLSSEFGAVSLRSIVRKSFLGVAAPYPMKLDPTVKSLYNLIRGKKNELQSPPPPPPESSAVSQKRKRSFDQITSPTPPPPSKRIRTA